MITVDDDKAIDAQRGETMGGCKDCDSCTRSFFGKLGKAALAVSTGGLTTLSTAVAAPFRRKCPQCGHPMSDHEAVKVQIANLVAQQPPQPQIVYVQVPTPVPLQGQPIAPAPPTSLPPQAVSVEDMNQRMAEAKQRAAEVATKRASILAAIETKVGKPGWTKKTFVTEWVEYLSPVFFQDEEIIIGSWGGNGANAMTLITNYRIICIRKKLSGAEAPLMLNLSDITSASSKVKLTGAQLTVVAGGQQVVFDTIDPKERASQMAVCLGGA